MQLGDADLAAFKHWLLPKLELFDADTDVLANYVIALVTAKDPEPVIRLNCLDQLGDFLEDNTGPFVEEVLAVLRNKSYRARAPVKTQVNGAKAQGATNDSTATPVARDKRAKCAWYARPPELRPPFGAPRCPAAMRGPAARRASGATGAAMSAPNGLLGQYHDAAASRKRKASEHETEEHYGTAAAGAKRVNNGARSSLRGSAPPFQPQTGSPAFAPNAHNALFSGLPNLPPFPPGPLPPADFISMMAAFGKAMPGMPPLPVPKKNKEKCSHYYTKGHCALGTLCQFVHGDDAKFVPGDDPGFLHGDDATPANRIPEYDPQQPALSMQQQTTSRTIVNGRHGTNGTHANSVSRRALVVERIPEESHNAGNVRAYFSQFGTITEVKSQVNRAIVTFEDHASAQKALDSPKAVFDNRFVKVSWYQPTELAREASPGSYGDVEMLAAKGYDAWPPLDLEAIAKRQAESQKLFEERQRKKNEVDAKAADIDKKLLKTDLEIKAIKHQIAELACDASGYSEEQTGHQLANLDTTLESLFKAGGPAPHELRSDVPGQAFNDSVSFPPSGRSWRGRFEFPGRRSFRGRGGFEGRGAYMAVKRLDFRPRRLVVSNIEEGSAKRKVLMRYLVGLPGSIEVDSHPEQPDTVMVTFEERYQAEMFLEESRNVPGMNGPLDITWVPNDAFGGLSPSTTTVPNEARSDAGYPPNLDGTNERDDDVYVKIEESDEQLSSEPDLDVAEDRDQWL